MQKIFIQIPTYNEKENLEKLIPQIFNIDPNYNILIIDDNSPDGTREWISKQRKKSPT